jgi:flagellar basal body-associated protein FliL
MKILIAVVVVIIIIALIAFVYYMFSSGFGNSRNVGSGCGRYNQLQRAINMEFPISQTEYEDHEMAKQAAAGIQYASTWQPPMENVYAPFQDRKTDVEVEHYQQLPSYPQTNITQSVYNDNVFKNIAYE